MLTGGTPPSASIVSESALEGDNLITSTLTEQGISDTTSALVTKAMWPASSKRFQSVKDLILILDELLDETEKEPRNRVENPNRNQMEQTLFQELDDTLSPTLNSNLSSYKKKKIKPTIPRWLYVSVIIVVLVIVYFIMPRPKYDSVIGGFNNGHSWVDLGLSVKWATCNVGASKPEDFGDYYSWGETFSKDDYSVSSYRYCYENYKDSIIKYCNKRDYAYNDYVDNKTELEPGDDVAYNKWGGNWRMPTKAEFQELLDSCSWKWTINNGVKGFKVTSKKHGYMNRYIFLPAAGSRLLETSKEDISSYGYYWTSSLYVDSPDGAWVFYFDSNNLTINYTFRFFGSTVRPVCP